MRGGADARARERPAAEVDPEARPRPRTRASPRPAHPGWGLAIRGYGRNETTLPLVFGTGPVGPNS